MNNEEAIATLGRRYAPATYVRCVDYLTKRPAFVEDIALHLGMTINSTFKLIAMLKKLRVVCVKQFIESGKQGGPRRLYGLGCQDAPKRTPAQRSKKWRDKQEEKQVDKLFKPKSKSPVTAPTTELWGIKI